MPVARAVAASRQLAPDADQREPARELRLATIAELRELLAPWTDAVELQVFERDRFVCYELRRQEGPYAATLSAGQALCAAR
jgi:hypothetical protein